MGYPGPSDTRPAIFCISSSLGVATNNSRKNVLSILDYVSLYDVCTILMRPQLKESAWQRTAMLQATTAQRGTEKGLRIIE